MRKTATSNRIKSIPQEAVGLLIAEHEKHPNNPYMFPSPVTGEMYYPDAVSKLHTKILKSAGLEHIRFHDLRHPYVKHATKKYDRRSVRQRFLFEQAGRTQELLKEMAKEYGLPEVPEGCHSVLGLCDYLDGGHAPRKKNAQWHI